MDTLGVIKSVTRNRPCMKLDLQQVSSDDDSSPCCEVIAVDNLRRQSTASNISRHSSCPDLARKATKSIDQWENDVANLEDFDQTTDDLALNQPNLPSRVNKSYKMNSATRKFRQRLQSDQSYQEASADVLENLSSANSTPTSAHHVAALLSMERRVSNANTVDVPKMTFSPTSSCDLPLDSILNHRRYQASSRCSIAGSASDFPSTYADEGNREDVSNSDVANSGVYLTEYTNCVPKRNHHNFTLHSTSNINRKTAEECVSDEGNIKCQKWLQSCELTKLDIFQSRIVS